MDLKVEYRKHICKSCEHLKKIVSICSKCGCIMPIKWKMADATCPIGKW